MLLCAALSKGELVAAPDIAVANAEDTLDAPLVAVLAAEVPAEPKPTDVVAYLK